MSKSKNETSLRTPLGKARGLGTARDGTHHWWMQRVSSVLLLPLCLYIGFHLNDLTPDGDFSRVKAASAIGDPVMSIALILAVITGFYHAWLGIQVVVEDYVHCHVTKPILLLLNTFFFFVLGAACVFSVLFIDFMLMR